MCGQRDLFSDLDETIQGQVTFGDTSKVPVKGKGNIPIKLKNDDCCYSFLDPMFAGRLTKADERNIFSKPCLSCFLLSLSFPFAAKIIRFS